MSPRAVHQVVAGAAPFDAITNHVLAARDHLRARGIRSEVYADDDHVDRRIRREVSSTDAMLSDVHEGDVLILHFSIGSAIWDLALSTGARCVLHYHNVTPAELIARFDMQAAKVCDRGRHQLADIAPEVGVSTGDSAYNVSELAALGIPTTNAVGILREIGTAAVRRRPPRRRGMRLLFVGRLAPNKAQHDVIRALAAVRAEIDPDATLDLVGLAQFVRYAAACRALTRRLGLEDAVRFRGSVSERALRRAYRDSDVFVCLSDHEGFCVPLLEAFAARLPVVAYASSAVTETARDAALLLPMKPPSLVAEAVGEITANARLRAELRVGQGERLADFAPAAVRARFDRFVDEAAA